MDFCPIFKEDNPGLWSVCYPKDNGQDVFDKFFEQINDTEFLFTFFKTNQHLLPGKFWNDLSVDEAIDQVLDEAYEFERELKCLEIKGPGCRDIRPREIFEPLDEGEYVLNRKNRTFRKARASPVYFTRPMLRIYAIVLDDDTFIITGGAIKLTRKMEGDHFTVELNNLKKVRDYIRSNKIVSKEGLY